MVCAGYLPVADTPCARRYPPVADTRRLFFVLGLKRIQIRFFFGDAPIFLGVQGSVENARMDDERFGSRFGGTDREAHQTSVEGEHGVSVSRRMV